MPTMWKNNNNYITTWDQFEEHIRSRDLPLLKELDKFPRSVLVTGCQRSGTTMLSRLLTQSSGIVNYWFSPDDELDAALILSGYVDHQPEGRYCFQTTYINENYHEYFEHGRDHKIIFILRNPLSVIYSMLYNWKSGAADGLFDACGIDYLTGRHRWLYKYIGKIGVGKLYRACFAYNGKVSQLYKIKETLGSEQLIVLDYDEIVLNKDRLLPELYNFVQLAYNPAYSDKILQTSVQKREKLSKKERSVISQLCLPVYNDLKRFCTL